MNKARILHRVKKKLTFNEFYMAGREANIELAIDESPGYIMRNFHWEITRRNHHKSWLNALDNEEYEHELGKIC